MSLKESVILVLIYTFLFINGAVYSLVAQTERVKNPPAMQETWVWSLEEGMATHSSILAWRIPMDKEPGGLQSMRSQSRTWLTKHTQGTFTNGNLIVCLMDI